MTIRLRRFAVLLLLGVAHARADGLVIDKVYHPYVDALEREFEYRAIVPDEEDEFVTPAQLHRASLGTALGTKVFTELNLIGEKERGAGFAIEAWELETKWQLTEQGEYAADFGLLFEYEAMRHGGGREVKLGLLTEKEWGRWSGAANLHLVNEWGGTRGSELETIFAAQLRRRGVPLFEPGVEFYAGQGTRGAGPVIQGTAITGVRRSLHWEAGVIFALDEASSPSTWRFLVESEFRAGASRIRTSCRTA
jgi:hypothetical protein